LGACKEGKQNKKHDNRKIINKFNFRKGKKKKERRKKKEKKKKNGGEGGEKKKGKEKEKWG